VERCGICGSDLHARRHADEVADLLVEVGYEDFMRSDQRIVLGHEFCGTVAEYGPGCRERVPTGAPVVSLPLLRRAGTVHAVGLSVAALARQAPAEHEAVVPTASERPPPPGATSGKRQGREGLRAVGGSGG
jgi:Alcohol dehydrogenase GroES-like domain